VECATDIEHCECVRKQYGAECVNMLQVKYTVDLSEKAPEI